jgi:DNA replication protein DnaC
MKTEIKTLKDLVAFQKKEADRNGKTTEEVPPLDQSVQTVLSRPLKTRPSEDLTAAEALRMSGNRVSAVAKDLGVRYAPDAVKLDAYTIYDPRQRQAVESVKAFKASMVEHVKAGDGVIFYGCVGTGKDFLVANLLYTSANAGFQTRWFNCQRLYAQLRDRIGANQREQDLVAQLTEPAVIGLSDPVAANDDLNAWRMEFLYRVVDVRYCARRPTFMTMNAKTPEDADAKLGQQVFDRLQESALMVPCFWQSYRERKRG